MASVPVWQPAQDAQFFQHVVQRVAQSFQRKFPVLANNARIKSSSDFARVTKTGRRISTNSLIGYLYSESNNDSAKLGLIVGKSIGNSVVRHRIARQIRHAVHEELNNFPNGTLLVVRAMKRPENAFTETQELITKTIKTLKANA
jgi:ribonuclease P protein component